jgi:hypothetical protein
MNSAEAQLCGMSPQSSAWPVRVSDCSSRHTRVGAAWFAKVYRQSITRHDTLQPATGTWALAQAIWAGDLLAAEHETVQDFLRLLDRIDDEEGIPAETGWLTYRSVWTY